MPRAKTFSTPIWPAEERAWLLVHMKRINGINILTESFNKQFPNREREVIKYQLGVLRRVKDSVKSQLEDLAKQFPWYQDMPQKGEEGYKQANRAEKREDARHRIRQKSREIRSLKSSEMTADPTKFNVEADAASTASLSRGTIGEILGNVTEKEPSVSSPRRSDRLGSSNGHVSLSSSEPSPGTGSTDAEITANTNTRRKRQKQ